jgi:PAS domain S-box-containing protein
MDATWIGKHVSTLPWPAGMPGLFAQIEQVQLHGRTHVSQLCDVGLRDWLLRVMPRVQADGTRGGVLLQMEDNTELRRSQLAAMRSSAQLQQLVERSAQLVCISDPAGRLQMANPEFERGHQLQAASAAGKLVAEILPEPRAQAFRDAQLEAMRTLAPVEQEETLQVGDEQRHLLASYYPLLDADGAVSGVCYQALDITHRKQAEGALLAATGAQLAAEGMARTKGSFLANMSHEIRTPMNAVLGLTRMVLEGDLPPMARDQLSKVHEAALGLTRILDDVLDFSKIEAGALRFENRPFALFKVLSGVRSLFSASAQQKQLMLTMDLPLGVPLLLRGDAFRLSQVLNNLVSNALKFTAAGEIRIGVAPLDTAAAQAAEDWCELRFSVRDTGLGIAADARDKLFQAFTQGDASVTRRFGGTGLGLAICQRLVDMMQGRIGVNSTLGQGSEFWFTARFQMAQPADEVSVDAGQHPPAAFDRPAVDASAAVAARSDSAAQALPAPAPARERGAQAMRVLLADDNVLNQIVSQAVIERMGHEVVVVGDGAEALAEVCKQPPGHFDVVLMDVHMPVMDGLEATRRIRAHAHGQALPILALTAAALPEDRENCLAAGMHGHIAKPLEPAQLQEALRATALGKVSAQGLGLPAVPGFDMESLLDRVHHNVSLAWKLLDQFVTQEGQTAAALEDLMREKRYDETRLRTHTLMGSAAALGAVRISEMSATLNAALRNGSDTPAMLQSLSAELRLSIGNVQSALGSRML